MIDDTFILDCVIHAYNFSPENLKQPEIVTQLAEMLYGLCASHAPRNAPEYTLDHERFMAAPDVDLLAHALFAESRTDAAIFHEVPQFGTMHDGGSPMWVGKELRDRYPGRIALYGAVAPFYTDRDPLEEIDRLVEEDGVVGLKLYPMDIVDGVPHSYRMDDPEACFPILERAQQTRHQDGRRPQGAAARPGAARPLPRRRPRGRARRVPRAEHRDRPRRHGVPRRDGDAPRPLPERGDQPRGRAARSSRTCR